MKVAKIQYDFHEAEQTMIHFASFSDKAPCESIFGLKNMWLGWGSNTDQTAHEPLPATELLAPCYTDFPSQNWTDSRTPQ